MSIMDRKHIDVLSYEPNVVVVPTVNNRSYVFRAADSFNEPVVIPIPPDEITYINSNCSAFRVVFFVSEIKTRMRCMKSWVSRICLRCFALRKLMICF